MAKILIIEDDEFINRMYQRVFELEHYDVSTAFDGPEGIDKAKAEAPDIILLDIMMPKMDGLLVAERLKKDEKTKDIPVIVLSNLVGGSDVENAKLMGAIKYIVKSQYEPAEIEKIVKQVLEGNLGDHFLENKNN